MNKAPNCFKSSLLENIQFIDHCFSGKYEGKPDEYKELLGWKSVHCILPKQTHGVNFEVVDSRNSHLSFDNTDALITREEGIFIGVKTADCVPVLLCDPQQKIIAAIHAGWRGTISEISAKIVQILKLQFNCNTKDIIAAIGPSAGVETYEVEKQLAANFLQHSWATEKVVVPFSDEKCMLDLKKANKNQLLGAGLLTEHIDVINLNTMTDDRFFSARREGVSTGRMVNGIFLNSNKAW